MNAVELRDNDWQLFRVLVNLGFERVGGPTDWAAVDRSLATVESNPSAFPFALEVDDTFSFATAESNLAFVTASLRHRQTR